MATRTLFRPRPQEPNIANCTGDSFGADASTRVANTGGAKYLMIGNLMFSSSSFLGTPYTRHGIIASVHLAVDD